MILPGVYLGNNVTIGENCVLHPNVVIYDNCHIGNHVTIHANTVIGNKIHIRCCRETIGDDALEREGIRP